MISKDKYLGFVFGVAIGDALGSPLEGLRSFQIKDMYNRVERYIDLPIKPTKHYKKPQAVFRLSRTYTDDTQNLLLSLDHLLKHNYQFNKEEMIEAFSEAYTVLRGIGKTTRKVLREYRKGKEDPANNEAPSNGTILRVVPFVLSKGSDFDEVREISNITHKNYSSALGAYFYALLIQHLKNNSQKDDALESSLNTITSRYKEDKTGLPTKEKEDAELLISNLHKAIEKKSFSQEFLIKEIGTSARVYHSLPTALNVFLISDNFSKTVFNAINIGGDTDSIGALAGGLSGAYSGFNVIDQNLKNIRNYDYVYDLTHRVATNDLNGWKSGFAEHEERLTFEETAIQMHIKREISKSKSRNKGTRTKVDGNEIIKMATNLGYNLDKRRIKDIKEVLKRTESENKNITQEQEREIIIDWFREHL